MGTINHKTSEYITLAIHPYDIDDFRKDEELADKTDEELYDLIYEYYEEDKENVEATLNKYRFSFFHVEIEPGYYEGFSIQIENNYPICYDNYKEKLEAVKEIKQIKAFLLDSAGMGMRACYPSWCTTYEDYKTTIKSITKAATDMRKIVLSIPCWKTLEKAGEVA